MPLAAQIVLNLAAAWAAGSAIGIERSYNGRVAGFRTHGLVGLASALTISLIYAPQLLPGSWPNDRGWLEPMALGQGIMTGVGFLGAGVIFKEGVSIQGLTTAASIWATAAVGLAFGLGMAWPGLFATVVALVTLTLLRMVEARLPTMVYALATFRFQADKAPSKETLLALVREHGMNLEDLTYRFDTATQVFEFEGSLSTSRHKGFGVLAESLVGMPGLLGFNLQRVSK